VRLVLLIGCVSLSVCAAFVTLRLRSLIGSCLASRRSMISHCAGDPRKCPAPVRKRGRDAPHTRCATRDAARISLLIRGGGESAVARFSGARRCTRLS